MYICHAAHVHVHVSLQICTLKRSGYALVLNVTKMEVEQLLAYAMYQKQKYTGALDLHSHGSNMALFSTTSRVHARLYSHTHICTHTVPTRVQ